ncbi:Mechanosensitive ion channel-domain-containing protein [Gilbertella persicaria]|nr:Mechanosensitive ion channel-domain-containing protein [Gilbertella persicaria]KAI8075448.1 Mechanosensitive ion channel-domain-containing protein [Gilbertella persicaria]
MHETKIEQVNHDEPLESHDQQASTPDTIVERPPHPRRRHSFYSALEALAGPALILPTTTDIDGRTLHEEFDWDAKDEDEDLDKKEDDDNDSKKKKRGALEKSSVIICFNENSSYIAWSCIVLFALIFIAIDIAIFVAYNKREQITMTSYGLQLWFTWIAFMWCIGFMSQILVELIPWAIKKSMGYLRPQSTEVLRMRLSYYMALRIYIKLILISAWAWGSWAFIQDHVQLPLISSSPDAGDQYASKPQYTSVFYSIWECCFFATLFLFVEKFILQLIVTSFHKKAYGDRIKENDKALRILDRLKKMKRKNPQEFLLKRIRRKPKTNSGTNTTVPSRSHSMDENIPQQGKSIMTGNQQYNDGKSNVKFPSQNMDTLIAIPPLEDRVNKSDDEKQDFQQIQEPAPSHEENKRKSFFNKLPKIKRTNTHSAEAFVDAPPPLVRDNTWFSRNSQDEKGFFSATRDFGLSTTAIPVKLFKGGYNKFVSQKNYGKQTGQPSQQAKYLAKKIYSNVLGPDSNRDKVIESDFYPFFRTTKEAAYAFSLFDADGNGDITKRELRSGCVRIYRERKNLTRSMRDLSQATGKLDIILMIVFVVIWVIIVCAAFGVNVGTDLMPLWSAFVAASFVFGTSAKDAFEAIIFVFVTHPFDAGDRVLIQGENWVVQNVGLLVTTFLKWDGSVVYAKNSVLTSQYIINVRRSGRTGETVELQISFSTPSWKIRKITEHMQKWCNEYPKLYTPNSASTNVTGFQNQNKITLSFYFEHTQNWQDPGGRWLRHNNFMWELKEECERLEINYTLPPQPFVAESKPNDAPPEAYNMGSKSGYGLEGMQQRRPFQDNDDEIKNVPIGAESGGHAGNSASDNSGAAAGAASTLMFAADM